MKRLIALLALLCASVFAQSSTPTSCPPVTGYFSCTYIQNQAIPTVLTAMASSTVVFGGGWFGCSGGQTVTIKDGNGVQFPPGGITAVAGQLYSLNLLAGVIMPGGWSISASATGCNFGAWWRF